MAVTVRQVPDGLKLKPENLAGIIHCQDFQDNAKRPKAAQNAHYKAWLLVCFAFANYRRQDK
jgi:hypothetical protein